MSRRLEKISRLIVAKVSELLLFKSNDPRLHKVNITRTIVSGDMKKAKVFYSVLGDQEAKKSAETALKKAAGFIRFHLADHLGLRVVPELAFVFDKNPEYAQHINELLSDLTGQDRTTEDPDSNFGKHYSDDDLDGDKPADGDSGDYSSPGRADSLGPPDRPGSRLA
jgi:ribosome-binding factor A